MIIAYGVQVIDYYGCNEVVAYFTNRKDAKKQSEYYKKIEGEYNVSIVKIKIFENMDEMKCK